MEELDDKAYNKEVKVKGIDTTGEDAIKPIEPEDPIVLSKQDGGGDGKEVKTRKSKLPKIDPYINYAPPKTEGEARLRSTAMGLSTPDIKGDLSPININEILTNVQPINLGEHIPDAAEREKFLSEHGSKLYDLASYSDFQKYG
ncbi:MAG: hypothetical protein ACW980_23770, partial [Promethearchaeota archaeon]